MRQQFRDWTPKGDMRTTYKDNSGHKKKWITSQIRLLDNVQGIIDDYSEQDITLTNRQLYYQLVAADKIPNAQEVYKRICTFLTDARYGGHIDWDALEDRGRTAEMPDEWNDLGELVESATYAYRLPRWSDQDFYIELFCEKQALESVLKPVANQYHIAFGANKGYSSAAMMYQLSQRLRGNILDGKKTAVLYLGDHDPSGLDMVRDIDTRITEFLTAGDKPVSLDNEENFQVVPLALTGEQIDQFAPPPNPAKITDPRAKGYLEEYGDQSWELDALEPQVLREIAEEGILEFLDVDKYNAWVQKEKDQRAALTDFCRRLTGGLEDE